MKNIIKEEDFKQWLSDNRWEQFPDGTWSRNRCSSSNSSDCVWTNTTEAMYEIYLAHLKYMIERNPLPPKEPS